MVVIEENLIDGGSEDAFKQLEDIDLEESTDIISETSEFLETYDYDPYLERHKAKAQAAIVALLPNQGRFEKDLHFHQPSSKNR